MNEPPSGGFFVGAPRVRHAQQRRGQLTDEDVRYLTFAGAQLPRTSRGSAPIATMTMTERRNAGLLGKSLGTGIFRIIG